MSLIGSLLYFRITRPGILQAISKLAAFSSCHGIAHWKAAKHVLRYLKGTPNYGLLYSRSGKTIKEAWLLTMFVDSDYATDLDTRRSRAGYLLYLNNNLISYRSTLQRGAGKDLAPSTGTCEAEYKTLSLGLKEIIWVTMLLETMGIEIENPTLIWEDNSACIDITYNESACKRTKHIDVRHHFIRPSLFRFFRDIIVSDKILFSQ